MSHQDYSSEPLLPSRTFVDTIQLFPPLPKSMEFQDVVYTIELCITCAIDTPYSFDQLQGSSLSSMVIRPLVEALLYPKTSSGELCDFTKQHRGIVAALMVARADFLNSEEDDLATGLFVERGLDEARANAAELIAARFLYHVRHDSDRIEFITFECKHPDHDYQAGGTQFRRYDDQGENVNETTPLLLSFPEEHRREVDRKCCIDRSYEGFSALELAVTHRARTFLCSAPVESVIIGIWNGNIVFWDRIEIDQERNAHRYNPPRNPWHAQLFARLRVPRYRTFFMMANYAVLLILFYALLFRQQQEHLKSKDTSLTWVEIFMHVWFFGFIVDELTQLREAGLTRYSDDYWSVFDMTIITVYLVFCILRFIGRAGVDYSRTQKAYDVLSLEALLVVPRFFSFIAIYPYFGTLLPCLKQLAKEFFKFMSLILIIYLGFFTTFTFLGRSTFTIKQMSWLLVQVFYGNSSKGFEAAPDISPVFGTGLMLVFVTLSNTILVTVLVAIMAQRLQHMMTKAREEYIFMFASTVVESVTTAERLTYFYPPLNILAVVMRPLRVVLNHHKYRQLKLELLKVTHLPFAWMIYVFERLERWHINRRRHALTSRRKTRSFASL